MLFKTIPRSGHTSFFLALLLNVVITASANERPMPANNFPIRGFHLDLRIQVMKMPELYRFAKKLGDNGVNTLILEWEATYPFEKHPVIANQYAYSRKEIKEFINYCDKMGIEVIPLQQSFGHVEYILRHPRYRELREDPKDYSQVNPIREKECRELFFELFSDMISTHKSRYLHIGGDETYLLGRGKESKEKAAKLGLGRVYGDYIKMMCELVVDLGKIPVVWADIALKYPDALDGLPKQTVLVDWNYGWDLNRFGDHKKLLESGFAIWGSPSIRSHPDNYFLSDWHKHLNNISTFIPQARKMGYSGMVMTSWSTSGLYSYIMESSSDLVDLHGIRRVYPVKGFDLLIEAFFKALAQEEALNVREFVIGYGQQKFGLSNGDAQLFFHALITAPYEVNEGVVKRRGMNIEQLTDSAHYAWQTFSKLKVSKNKTGFGHFILMANIRYNYLVVVEVEAFMNKKYFTHQHASEQLKRLQKLNVAKVDAAFKKLNRNMLYDAEIDHEQELRNYRYYNLVGRLKAFLK